MIQSNSTMSKEIVQAKEFTPLYDEREDRLRLIVNLHYPTRYDVWVTRRFLLKIVDELVDFLDTTSHSTSNHSTKENQLSSQQPIYPFDKEPKIVERLDISHDKNSGLFNLQLYDGNIAIVSSMKAEELKQLIQFMLNQVRFQWGLNFY